MTMKNPSCSVRTMQYYDRPYLDIAGAPACNNNPQDDRHPRQYCVSVLGEYFDNPTARHLIMIQLKLEGTGRPRQRE